MPVVVSPVDHGFLQAAQLSAGSPAVDPAVPVVAGPRHHRATAAGSAGTPRPLSADDPGFQRAVRHVSSVRPWLADPAAGWLQQAQPLRRWQLAPFPGSETAVFWCERYSRVPRQVRPGTGQLPVPSARGSFHRPWPPAQSRGEHVSASSACAGSCLSSARPPVSVRREPARRRADRDFQKS